MQATVQSRDCIALLYNLEISTHFKILKLCYTILSSCKFPNIHKGFMPHEQHPRGRYPSIETASSKTQLSCTFNRVVPSIHLVRNADVSKKGFHDSGLHMNPN